MHGHVCLEVCSYAEVHFQMETIKHCSEEQGLCEQDNAALNIPFGHVALFVQLKDEFDYVPKMTTSSTVNVMN